MEYERFMRTYRCLLRVRDSWDSLFYALTLEKMTVMDLRQEALNAQDPGR
jgi:hypothetical protein